MVTPPTSFQPGGKMSLLKRMYISFLQTINEIKYPKKQLKPQMVSIETSILFYVADIWLNVSREKL